VRSRSLFQLLAAVALVAGLWHLTGWMGRGVERRRLAPGWTIVRPPAEVCTMAVVGETLWTGGKDGLVIVHRRSLHRLPPSVGAPTFGRVWAILAGRHDRVWVGHDGGLSLFSRNRWTAVKLPGLRRVLALARTSNGGIVAGGEAGVAMGGPSGWHRLRIPPEQALPSYDVVFPDPDGTLWLGSSNPTRGGLLGFDGATWTRYAVGRELPHGSVNCVLRDHEGALWVGTGFAGRGGAARFAGGRWTFLGERGGLAGPKVRSIFPDREGLLWFGSEYHGLAVLEPGGAWHRIPPGRGLAGREVKVMLEDAGGYWFGTDQGLSRFQKDGGSPWPS